jgi:hypothetical protein
MLHSWRTSAGGGALALLLALGCWIVSEANSRASTVKDAPHGHSASAAKVGHAHPHGATAKPAASHQWTGASKPAGQTGLANHHQNQPFGTLARMENQLEREIAEVRQLEQAIDNMLDYGSNYPQSGSGNSSGSFSPGSGGGTGTGITGATRHHHRRGHMWRGMELARLMYRLERDERRLENQERQLSRELARLRELERNLNHLKHMDKVGHRTEIVQRQHSQDAPRLTIVNHDPRPHLAAAAGNNHLRAGSSTHPALGPSHSATAKTGNAGQPRPPVHHAASSPPAGHARSAAHSVGHAISSPPRPAAVHRH